MRILLTNDDGIHAPGLEVLERIAAELSDDVWVVAPELDQSGLSHSLSLNDPLRLRQISEKRFALRGTPSDCVIMAGRSHFARHQPELLPFRRQPPNIAPGSDLHALEIGATSVTPLRLDMTAYDLGDPLRHHFAGR